MNKNNTFAQKLEHFLSGKGFYAIVLACICIVGISAWAMFYEKSEPETLVETSVSPQTKVDAPKVQEKAETDKPTLDEKKDLKAVTVPEEDEAYEVSAPVVPEDPKQETVFSMPLKGEVVSAFSDSALVYSPTLNDWRTHLGTDIAAEVGTDVTAVADGEVIDVFSHDLLGTSVVIKHLDGVESCYSNLDTEVAVSKGDVIKSGAVIGKVRSTAIGECKDVSHLHLAMTLDGKPVDPMEYLKP